MIGYRSDIDGLRTIAVASVILFHFSIGPFSGGYVGVDIFFTISGFLIGRSVIEQSISSKFSIVNFAERRIRRLYPALIAMLASTAFVSYIVLLPADLREFGKSLIATVFNVSNFQFYRESGYFDAGAVNKPLLHTWSLAIEEQFYILLPVIMIVYAKLQLNTKYIYIFLITIVIFSFALACMIVNYDQPAVFYLFFGRVWELGIGTAIAYSYNYTNIKSYLRRTLLSITGLSIIILCVILYTEDIIFPGISAIPPIIGTLLLIIAGNGGDHTLTPVLSFRPIVFIGKISYSLYLWHWPIFVFVNYYYVGNLSHSIKFASLIITFIFSVISWKFIEQPFRKKRFLTQNSIFKIYGASSLIMSIAGVLFWKLDGIPQRYNEQNRLLAVAAGDFLQNQGICDDGPIDLLPGLHVCKIGKRNIAPTVLIWGDSHARAFRTL